MLTVADLAADPALRLRVVAGHRNLDRTIEAAAVSELVEPGPVAAGRRAVADDRAAADGSPRRAAAVRGRLEAAGVQAPSRSGSGPSCGYQEAPADLVRAADAVGLPLLEVPDRVPFIAVTKAVFAFHAREERRQLEWALRTQQALTAAAVRPGGLVGILAAHAGPRPGPA